MKKPTLYTTEINMFGEKVRVANYLTDTQIHNAMKDYARSKDKKSLYIKTTFKDGSCTIDEFEPFKKEVHYKTYDGEQWTIEVDSSKYDPDFLLTYWEQPIYELYGFNDKPYNGFTKAEVRKWLVKYYDADNRLHDQIKKIEYSNLTEFNDYQYSLQGLDRKKSLEG